MTTLGFTRPSKRIKESIELAKAMGFEALGAPSMDILPGEDSEFIRLEDAIAPGSVVVFCSVTAVEECRTRFGDGLKSRFEGCRVVSIGPSTTAKLESVGISPEAVPDEYSSEGLVRLLKDDVAGKRVILIRSDSGSDVLSDGMRAAGADLVDIASYRLKDAGMSIALLHLMTMIKQGRLDVMAFTSPKSASIFVSQVEDHYGKDAGDAYLSKVKIAAIGGPTSEMLTRLGFKPDIVPANSTFEDMLKAIREAIPQN